MDGLELKEKMNVLKDDVGRPLSFLKLCSNVGNN